MAFLLLLFVMLPVGLVVLLYTFISGKTGVIKRFFFAGGAGIFLLLLLFLLSPLWKKMELAPEDCYGTYVIDRSFYPGRQADWQYNHFRLEVLPSDSVIFYQTEGSKIVATYRGKASWGISKYRSARMRLEMDSPTHFVMASNPTTYRFVWNFRLVFATKEFGNVAFEKGAWEAL